MKLNSLSLTDYKNYIIINKIYINIFLIFLNTFVCLYIDEKYENNSRNVKNNNLYKPKIIGISYSNIRYQTQLQLCKKSALEIGKVDYFYDYGPEDIDLNFKNKNQDILGRKRGNGYWLWKPYFIFKTLNEKLDYGDYLIYTDATVLYKNNINILIDFIKKKNKDMWFYKLPFLEKMYCKRDCFILMGADSSYYTNTYSYNAAFQLYKKSDFSMNFLKEYIYYGTDKRIITDDINTFQLPNYKEFKDHRHDQSILSILIKKYNQANSGKPNINYTLINNFNNEMPFIFCHYRRKHFNNYNDLKKLCNMQCKIKS